MLKINKIKPVLTFPLLFVCFLVLFIESARAQTELIPFKEKELDSRPITYNALTINVTPVLIFNPESNNGSATIQFRVNWSGRKNEGLFLIAENKTDFEAFCKANKWDIKNKVSPYIKPSLEFSPQENIFLNLKKSEFFYEKSSQFSIDFVSYPVDPVKMSVTFFLGFDAKVKAYVVEDKAITLEWSFKAPKSKSKDCTQKLQEYATRFNKLKAQENKNNWEQYDGESEKAAEDLKKIKDNNKELKNIISAVENDIQQNECTDMNDFLSEIKQFVIDDIEFTLAEKELKAKTGEQKKVEEAVQSLNVSLSQSFTDIEQLYRELFDINYELGKTGKADEATISSLQSKLDQYKQEGDQAYQTLGADQKRPEVKLLKEGFDQFYNSSTKLLEEISSMKSGQSSTGTDDQVSTPGKEKKGFLSKYWYLIPSLIIIILAIVLVKYWGTIMKAFHIKKKVESQ